MREIHDGAEQVRLEHGQPRYFQSTRNGVTTSSMHGLGNQRTVQSIHPDGTRVVSYGAHNGYVERPFAGHPEFVTRSVVRDGVTHVSVYQQASFQGHPYSRFVPVVAYRPAFYTWVSTRWVTPVSYGWGNPAWGGVYGAYFVPYGTYSSPSLWLTDYILYNNLQQAYLEQQPAYEAPTPYAGAAGAPGPDAPYPPAPLPPTPPSSAAPESGGGGAPYVASPLQPSAMGTGDQLSPQVKALIAQQVQTDVGEMQSQAAQISANPNATPALTPATYKPAALQPNHVVFEISTDMQLQVGPEQSCSLTPGDTLFRKPGSMPDASGNVSVIVVGSTHGGCPVNTVASISLEQLQEIDNQFQDQLQVAFGKMQQPGGQAPLPGSPAGGAVQLAGVSTAAVGNPDALVEQNQALSQQTEADVTQALQTTPNP